MFRCPIPTPIPSCLISTSLSSFQPGSSPPGHSASLSSFLPALWASWTLICRVLLVHSISNFAGLIKYLARRNQGFILAPGTTLHHSREGVVARAGYQLLTSPLQSGSLEWTGSEVRRQNFKFHPYWPTFSGKSSPPKGSMTFPNSTTT